MKLNEDSLNCKPKKQSNIFGQKIAKSDTVVCSDMMSTRLFLLKHTEHIIID